jgi:hypothetical protein
MRRVIILFAALLLPLIASVGLASAHKADINRVAAGPPAAPVVTVLYDGALGTLPGEQGFDYLAYPAGATQTISNGGTILDTTASQGISAGYFGRASLMPVLDRTAGYTVTFEVQLLAESHSTPHRAGFSLIALSDDDEGSQPVLGIELAFWPDEIWAQDDDTQGGTIFTHAEGAAFDTSQPLTYSLHIVDETYSLAAGGQGVLSGRLRDYSGWTGFPDPYETPNFHFLGDDTTSASGRVKIYYVAVTLPGLTLYRYLPLIAGP